MTGFDRRLKVARVTYVWQRDELGLWNRYLLREMNNKRTYWSQLYHVLTDVPTCFVCLSNRCEVRDDDERYDEELYCFDCGSTYRILEEEPDTIDDLEE